MQSKTKDQMSSYTNNGRIIHVEVQCMNIRPRALTLDPSKE